MDLVQLPSVWLLNVVKYAPMLVPGYVETFDDDDYAIFSREYQCEQLAA